MLLQRFEKLAQNLQDLEDIQDRLEFFVEQAGHSTGLPEDLKIENFRVQGCISNLWIVPELKNQRCYYRCDGDAVIPKGIAVSVLEVFTDSTPEEILNFDLKRLAELGITEILSPNRRNALSRICDVAVQFARASKN